MQELYFNRTSGQNWRSEDLPALDSGCLIADNTYMPDIIQDLAKAFTSRKKWCLGGGARSHSSSPSFFLSLILPLMLFLSLVLRMPVRVTTGLASTAGGWTTSCSEDACLRHHSFGLF